jgi:hypothetical protein
MPHGDAVASFLVGGTPRNALSVWTPTNLVAGTNDLAGFAARFGFALPSAAGTIPLANRFDPGTLRAIMNSTAFGLAGDLAGSYIPTPQDVYDAQFVCATRGTPDGDGFYPNAQTLWDYLVAWAATQVYAPHVPPLSMADAIYSSGKVRTYCKAYYLPGVTTFQQVLTGLFNPGTSPAWDPLWTGPQLSEAQILRYGHGFGRPVTQDLTVLPAISLLPDSAHDNYAALYEETFEAPNANVLLLLGFATGYALSGWDRSDVRFCADFEAYVIAQNILHP